MKILFLSGIGQGGAERQVQLSANLLSEKGHNVTIMTVGRNKPFYSVSPSVRIVRLDNVYVPVLAAVSVFRDLFALISMWWTIHSENADVVISYITKLNVALSLVRIASLRSRSVFLASERSSRLQCTYNRRWRLVCRTLHVLNGFYTNSTITRRRMVEDLNIPPSKVQILRNLIDTDHFSPALDWPGDTIGSRTAADQTIRILVSARFSEAKNQRVLIPVVRRLIEAGRENICFVLAGEGSGPYATVFRKELGLLGIDAERYFEILGPVSDIEQQYRDADIVLIPSLWEGFPNVLLEAMACGALVVTTNVSDIETIVTDHRHVVMTKGFTPEDISEALLDVLNMTPTERNALKRSARQLVLTFGKDYYYERLMEIINFHIERKRRDR